MLIWNVYIEDSNRKEIKEFNIFDHYAFYKSIVKILKTKLSKEDFAERINRELLYYYWCKSEWEIILTSFPPYVDKVEVNRIKFESEQFNIKHGHYPFLMHFNPNVVKKVDVYSQVKLNWDNFIEYLWSQKRNVRREV